MFIIAIYDTNNILQKVMQSSSTLYATRNIHKKVFVCSHWQLEQLFPVMKQLARQTVPVADRAKAFLMYCMMYMFWLFFLCVYITVFVCGSFCLYMCMFCLCFCRLGVFVSFCFVIFFVCFMFLFKYFSIFTCFIFVFIMFRFHSVYEYTYTFHLLFFRHALVFTVYLCIYIALCCIFFVHDLGPSRNVLGLQHFWRGRPVPRLFLLFIRAAEPAAVLHPPACPHILRRGGCNCSYHRYDAPQHIQASK